MIYDVMNACVPTKRPAAGVRLRRVMVVVSALGVLAGLSYLFMPPGVPDRREQRAARLLAGHLEDPSPLAGTRIAVQGVQVRRLEGLAVVTFTFDMFDERQELRPEARNRLLQFASGLKQVSRRVALDIAGYAPEFANPEEAYALGLSRATGVARCLVAASGIPPDSVSTRSLGHAALHGDAGRPHAVVIAVAALDDISPQLARLQDGGL